MKRIITLIMVVMAFVANAVAANRQEASFPGGEKACKEFITKNLVYPETSKENGVEGVVVVSFTVKTDGSIGNIKIKRMVDPDLEAEAIRVVKKMPKWEPASEDGAAVESTAELSFPFTLE